MTLLRAYDISLSFGSRTLFTGLEIVVEAGERVGLIGVNGCGKSTLMGVLAREIVPDSGVLQLQRGARVAWLSQEPSFPEGATPESELEVAQFELRAAIAAHRSLADCLADGSKGADAVDELSALGERIEHLGGWDTAFEARKLLDRLGVPAETWTTPVAKLSGGQRKRVAIARALLSRADLLLLDEPTNHLDAETVEWLEDELDAWDGALLLVTHDRYFLDGLVDRIVELEPHVSEQQRGGLVSYPGNFEAFLEQRYVALENAASSEHKRQRWIAQEVAWLRRGPQARRTKSKARIERARRLLAERGFRRPQVPDLQVAPAPRLSQTVIEAKGLGKSFGTRRVLDGVDLIVQPGERIGLVGPNGAGKTTLLRLLTGELPADEGSVKLGPRTRIAYFDQFRASLDPEKTVLEAAWDEDWVELGGSKVRLSDYLEDLLFPVPMQRMRVKALSGGERNRLLLARLFLEGANVLVLDEPTNDLDLMTLGVLERLLVQFPGAVLLVTHDRAFLDRVATALLVFDRVGHVVRYEGNYELYRRLRGAAAAPNQRALEQGSRGARDVERPSSVSSAATAPVLPGVGAAPVQREARRLSYKEQRELEGMEAAIEACDARKAALEGELQLPAVYERPAELARVGRELEGTTQELERLYARWDELLRATG